LSALLSFLLVSVYETGAREITREVEWAADPAVKERILANHDFLRSAEMMTYDDAVDRLEAMEDPLRTQVALGRSNLTLIEVDALDNYLLPMIDARSTRDEKRLMELLLEMKRYESVQQAKAEDERQLRILPRNLAVVSLCVAGFFYLCWLAFAFAFRGGLSWFLGGITLVQSDGRPAGRFRVLARAALVWLPVVALLAGLTWLQVVDPTAVAARVVLTIAVPVLLLAYFVVAIRYPDRPPQDQLLGTYLVPV
jgi:hypothetical protein